MSREVRTPLGFVALAATPSNPPAGTVLIYAKTDGKFYQLTSAGVETDLTATGGGGGSGLDHKQVMKRVSLRM